MSYSDQFFKAIGIRAGKGGNLSQFSKSAGIPVDRLKFYNQNNVIPSGKDLKLITKTSGVSESVLKLKMGRLDKDLLEAIQEYADEIAPLISKHKPTIESPQKECTLEFQTKLGKLYKGDCYTLLKTMNSDSIDMVFADPPFNLSKQKDILDSYRYKLNALFPENIKKNREKRGIWTCESMRKVSQPELF